MGEKIDGFLRSVLPTTLISLVLVGCTLSLASCVLSSTARSLPPSNQTQSTRITQFDPPSAGHAGLYVFRGPGMFVFDIWIDGKCLGSLGSNGFFHEEVPGDMEHAVSTDSAFSPNTIKVFTESGKNYFVQQIVKRGVYAILAKPKLEGETEGSVTLHGITLATPRGVCRAVKFD